MEPRATRAGLSRRATQRRTAKVGHRKSRTGCLTCRSRRVKCDEASPECNNCYRLGLHCRLPISTGGSQKDEDSGPGSILTPAESQTTVEHLQPLDLGEKSRCPSENTERTYSRLDMRLLHAWMSKAIRFDSSATLSDWRKVWLMDVPELALKYDYVLYPLLALSATQLSGALDAESDPELTLARYRYWGIALAEQRKMIGQIPIADSEPLTFAAFLISINAFAVLRDRNLEPYIPPVEWLRVSKGAWDVCPPRLNVRNGSILSRVLDQTFPIWKDRYVHKRPVHEEYEPLLRQFSAADTPDDMEVYRIVLALITSFREAILLKEPANHFAPRICILAQLIPTAFIDFLQEQRPRALAVLACFFALVARCGALQYFGDFKGVIPLREIRAISDNISAEWKGQISQVFDEIVGIQ